MNYILNVLFGKRKPEKKKSLIKEFMANPDGYTYQMTVKEDEIVIVIKKEKESD